MERKTITEVIFSKTYNSDIADVKFGDLLKDLQDGNVQKTMKNLINVVMNMKR